MDKSFSAVAGDVADIKHDMATKEQVITLHTQVNSIEGQLRGMNYIKLESRLADLEKKISDALARSPCHSLISSSCASRDSSAFAATS